MMAADGKLIAGLSRCDDQSVQDRCFIAAYDVNNGQQMWKFSTIADKGEPGGDTWGTLTNDQRTGADAWIAGTYDPKLNLTYWGTGQAKSGARGHRRPALQQRHARAGRRYRQAQMVLPGRAGRESRS